MPTPSCILTNVRLPSGRITDLTLTAGKIQHLGSSGNAQEVIDCSSLIVVPAGLDMHVHLRAGSQSHKEDWRSGTESAIAGGVTVVVDQPNTVPPLTTPEIFLKRVEDARLSSRCNFSINSAVTESTSIREMWNVGAMAFGEIFFGPSSYGDPLDEATLASSLTEIHSLGALATIHAETVSPGYDTGLFSHDRLRSAEGELEAMRRVERLNHTGCRLHFCHLSTGVALESSRSSLEVTPHHLFLSRDQFLDDDTFGKVNPPLRSEKERHQLWRMWERIDVIASDHAPHTRSEKQQNFADAPSGIPGVETMIPLLMAKVLEGRISLPSLIEKISTTPSRLLGIPEAGFVPGDRADFALYPTESVKIDVDQLHSRSGWTPFEGQDAIFPSSVIMGGELIYQEGDFFPGDPIWFTGKGSL